MAGAASRQTDHHSGAARCGRGARAPESEVRPRRPPGRAPARRRARERLRRSSGCCCRTSASVGDDTDRLFTYLGLGLFVGGVMYLVYLAIEPFVRRSWPTMLVGWSRALGGRLRDAVIGRDLIVGVVAGVLLLALDQINALVPHLIGRPDPIPFMPNTGMLEHPRYFLVTMASSVNQGLQNALLSVLTFTILREVMKRLASRVKARWASSDYAAAGLTIVIMTLIETRGRASRQTCGWRATPSSRRVCFWPCCCATACSRWSSCHTINSMVARTPLTLRGESLYALPAWLMLGVVFVVGVHRALAGARRRAAVRAAAGA